MRVSFLNGFAKSVDTYTRRSLESSFGSGRWRQEGRQNMHTMVCKATFLPRGRQTWGQIVSGVPRHIPVVHGIFFSFFSSQNRTLTVN